MNPREKLTTVLGWFSLGLNMSLIYVAEKSLDWYADLELIRAHRDGDFEYLAKNDILPVC